MRAAGKNQPLFAVCRQAAAVSVRADLRFAVFGTDRSGEQRML